MGRKAASNIFKSGGPADTARLARLFAAALAGGEVLLLEGPIGSGKTFFTRELARAFGVKSLPVSASFNMMRTYGGRLKLAHFDLFRAAEGDLANLGLDEYLGRPGTVAAVEWPAAAASLLAAYETVTLEFSLAGGEKRSIKISADGPAAEAALEEVKIKWLKN
jgi:tRNA threonylcarbamoyladenosine biosynthesis protein TsaE